MNTLFLNFENLSEVGGITKKILFQKEAMEKNGLNVSFSHIEKDGEGNHSLEHRDYNVMLELCGFELYNC